MALPDLIEIIPLAQPVRAEITVPGSKSITNRALILAALADGEVTLTGALWSEDTQVMTEALRTLGFDVRVENDPAEFCNRTITVQGQSGKIPKAGTAEQPVELFVGNAGTAARFLAAMVCLGGVYRLSGVPRMHERPQAALFQALRELGYRVDATNDKLPAVIHGQVRGERAEVRNCTVSINESSQFASALKLSAKHGRWDVKVAGDDDEEAPYVTMTERLVEVFPWKGGKFQIEPDASSGSYFWAAKQIQVYAFGGEGSIEVCHWPNSGWQVDEGFPRFLNLPDVVSRSRDLGDSILTAFVLVPFSSHPVTFTDLGRIRVQECDRLQAMFAGLDATGSSPASGSATRTLKSQPAPPNFNRYVSSGDDMLRLEPSGNLSGAIIDSYNDHRIAMCFAILGLKVPGIRLKNPACVKKTFPNFFQKLAAPPPNGLGVEIWEVKNGQRTRKLAGKDLFAD